MNTNYNQEEPDWSDSKTSPTEIWKNPFFTLQDRLKMADGSVKFYRDVIENLRSQLKDKEKL